MQTIGKTAISLVISDGEGQIGIIQDVSKKGYKVAVGRVGSMESGKVIAAIETAAKKEGLIGSSYRDEHALYHAALEAFYGVGRGELQLGNILRTVGLNFAVVIGPRSESSREDGNWVAVALYGTIGAPVKGWEHETIGLGINHK